MCSHLECLTSQDDKTSVNHEEIDILQSPCQRVSFLACNEMAPSGNNTARKEEIEKVNSTNESDQFFAFAIVFARTIYKSSKVSVSDVPNPSILMELGYESICIE